MIETAFLALGLVLIVEGLVYALAPSLVKQMLVALAAIPPEARRLLGLLALVIGLALVAAAKALGVGFLHRQHKTEQEGKETGRQNTHQVSSSETKCRFMTGAV